jgi:hypothetical protein
MIKVQQPTKPLTSLDSTVRVRWTRRVLDQLVREPLMVPFEPIVLHELMHRPCRCASPSGTIRSRHSLLIESSGNRSTSTPPLFIAARNSRVYSGSRSRIRYLFPSRKPSLASSRFRATCSIHRPRSRPPSTEPARQLAHPQCQIRPRSAPVKPLGPHDSPGQIPRSVSGTRRAFLRPRQASIADERHVVHPDVVGRIRSCHLELDRHHARRIDLARARRAPTRLLGHVYKDDRVLRPSGC